MGITAALWLDAAVFSRNAIADHGEKRRIFALSLVIEKNEIGVQNFFC